MAQTARELHDPTIYPVEDNLGESVLHMFIRELLRPLVEAFLASKGFLGFVGSEQFIYWIQFNATRSVSPDLYVIPGAPANAAPKVWKLWEMSQRVSFALEIVSDDWAKDYRDNPHRYFEMGVDEFIIFDPEPKGRDRITWQVFRRHGDGFSLTRRTNDDRVHSAELDCWFRVVGEGDARRIRIATGAEGDDLFPTADERAQQEQRRAKEEQRRAEELAKRVCELEAALAKKR